MWAVPNVEEQPRHEVVCDSLLAVAKQIQTAWVDASNRRNVEIDRPARAQNTTIAPENPQRHNDNHEL